MVFQRTIGKKNEDFLSELKEDWMGLKQFNFKCTVLPAEGEED